MVVRSIKNVPHRIRQPQARQAIRCLSGWPKAGDNCNKSIVIVRGHPGTVKRDSWGLPSQRSPAQPRSPQPSPRRRQAQALARVERRRQEARAPGLWEIFVRSMAHERGWWGGGVWSEGMGCAIACPAFVGLCRTQESTSGALPAQ